MQVEVRAAEVRQTQAQEHEEDQGEIEVKVPSIGHSVGGDRRLFYVRDDLHDNSGPEGVLDAVEHKEARHAEVVDPVVLKF